MNTSDFPNYAAWLERLKVVDQGVVVVLWIAGLTLIYLANFRAFAPGKLKVAALGLLVFFYGSMAALWISKLIGTS